VVDRSVRRWTQTSPKNLNMDSSDDNAFVRIIMANCIKTLGIYYGRPTSLEKVFPSSRPWSVRTVAPPKLTLGTDLKTKFVTMTVLTVAAFVYIIFMLIYVKIVRLL
jgi:hypothetical protein